MTQRNGQVRCVNCFPLCGTEPFRDGDLSLNEAVALLRLGRDAEAVSCLTAASARHPRHARLANALGASAKGL